MINNLMIYLLVGKLSIYLLQKFPPAEWAFRELKLAELFWCDLCLGVWVYFGLALLFRFTLFDTVSVFDELMTGAVASFLMHIFSIGWKEKFETVIVN